MSKKVIIGYSGHSYVVIDAAINGGLNIEAYAEKKRQNLNPFKLNYLGFENDEYFDGWDKGYEFILGIGDNTIREKATKLIKKRNEKLISVLHPSVHVGANVKIGIGTFSAAGVIINPLVKIGESVILNTGAIIEHECIIGDCVHISPGAVLAGNVKVGNRSFIGANSVIREGVEIGDNVVIGAGSVVLSNVESNQKVVGNPIRKL